MAQTFMFKIFNNIKSTRFLTITCLIFIVLITPVVLINTSINSYGYYGDYQYGEAPVFNAQIAKYYYLKNNSIKPGAFVLGSSNSMRVLPETIDSLFKLKAFNYGVYQASVEDFWCITNVILNDLRINPKLFIICVDDWNFRNYSTAKDVVFKGAQNRLAYKQVFSKYLPSYSGIVLNWCRVKTAISFKQLQTSWPLFVSILQGDTIKKRIVPLNQAFYNNGVRKHYGDAQGRDVVGIAERGEYKLTEYLMSEQAKKIKTHPKGIVKGTNADFEKFEEERFALFEQLIKLMESRNIKVIVNIMPLNKYFQSLLQKTGNYNQRMVVLKEKLEDIKSRHPNILLVADHQNIENFGGDTDGFFDEMHPTSVTSDKMLFSIKDKLGNYAF